MIAAIGGELPLSGLSGGRLVCRADVVAPDSLHAMFTGVPEGVLIHYAPESRVGQWLACLTAAGGPGA
ncbi:hypothetical protein ACWDBC_24200 [Streptomyces parvus]|uniref:hypothetical protein n=1 Tax=Streptomyces parvus TaxID=66428 RepID=UPI003321C675